MKVKDLRKICEQYNDEAEIFVENCAEDIIKLNSIKTVEVQLCKSPDGLVYCEKGKAGNIWNQIRDKTKIKGILIN